MEAGSVQEPEYEPLPQGKRGLLIALLYHLKERCGLELQDIAAPARSVSINDYCRRSAPKAEPAIFRGVYRTARAHPDTLAPWARSAFAMLYGEEPGPAPPNMEALLAQLFPQAIRDYETLEYTAEAHCGVYAIYRYRALIPGREPNSKIPEGAEFERERLEISRHADQPMLRFTLFHLDESFGRSNFHLNEMSGFIIPTHGSLYFIGEGSDIPTTFLIILPRYNKPVPSFTGMVLKHKLWNGFFAARILAVQAQKGQEDESIFQAGFVGLDELPLGESNAKRLRNIVPFDGRSVLTFPE